MLNFKRELLQYITFIRKCNIILFILGKVHLLRRGGGGGGGGGAGDEDVLKKAHNFTTSYPGS